MKFIRRVFCSLILGLVLISLTDCGNKSETKSSAGPEQVSTASNPAEAAKEWKENLKEQQPLSHQEESDSATGKSEKKPLLNDSELASFGNEVWSEALSTSDTRVSLEPKQSTSKEATKTGKTSKDLNSDFCSLKNTRISESKKTFVCVLLASAIRMNKQIYKQRLLVLALDKKSQSEELSDKEKTWLERIKNQYDLPAGSSFSELLSRVDIVPLALIVAQASIESGWGTSRASKMAKNLFGVHGVHGEDNCLSALQNANVCIKKYASFDQSIGDYIQFLNIKRSTQNFRDKRKQLRDRNQSLDAIVLASTLTTYSELGVRYTQMVISMMRKQNFVSLIFSEDDVEAETV